MKRYPIALVEDYVKKILMHYNLNHQIITTIVNSMITADACGVHSHGLSILKSHIDRLLRGGYEIAKSPAVIKLHEAFAVVDAQNTFGFLSADYCMNLAINQCRVKHGFFTVFARNCNTYGAAFYYTKLAADNKLIGITFCNSPTAMPAWGGKEKLLGTNPFAIAIPGKNEGPILFDMATSIVAKSKINEARKNGDKIPLGWALDEHGNDTTDPEEAIKGLILPMAGPKGYGLALVIDIIAGMLSGAAYSSKVNRFYSEQNEPMNVGQVFIAIDPTTIHSEQFYDEVDRYIEKIHLSASRDNNKVRFPGENKLHEYAKTQKDGLELTDYTVKTINELLTECSYKDKL